MSRFRPIDRQTPYLLSPSVQDWLPESHLARYVVDVVEGLDLSALAREYAGRGSAAYHPAMLLSLLIYGYATGIHSSRKIERATYDSLAFRYIACDQHPDHDTLANFRRRFEREQAEYEAKMAKRATKEKATGKKPGGRPPAPPAAGPGERDQVNLTDEDSRIMKVSGGGFEQSYNAQALVVDTQSLLVVVPHATQAVNDKAQVEPMLECVACLPEGLNEPEQQMKHLLKTRAGRAAYALRKQTVEPVFGIIKSVMGFRQFSMRGLEHVHHEWTLVCLAWNLKRMAVLRPQ